MTSAANGVVDVDGQVGLEAGGAVGCPAGTRQATLNLRRFAAGQPTSLNLVVADGCGEWPTVVGGGAAAF